MEWIASPDAWLALVTLTVMEIVLGIDNIVFISVLVGRLPQELRRRARFIGLSLALVGRIIFLLLITVIMRLQKPIFTLFGEGFSGRDLILITGGLFLMAKATLEIHHSLEGVQSEGSKSGVATATMGSVLVQIALIDLVFSVDSVITAVGMAEHVPVMVLAIVISIGVMMIAADPIGRFVDRHPTVKMLAMSFLILIGTALVADGLGLHIPKGYIYFAMAFSVGVEMLNLRMRKETAPVDLHKRM
ncbi:MAG: TerC family protein [Gammaproteobacteria bacterium]|nr:TerC family protein [Gammaproteobacteria bacterium]NNM21365.1 TerC family protein [Gammaproteobacteria bacterium]